MNCDEKLKEFEPLFNPRSVAVVGASRTPGKAGYVLVENLLNLGFRGSIYPINPNAKQILGLVAYRSVLEVPGTVDLAVVIVPA